MPRGRATRWENDVSESTLGSSCCCHELKALAGDWHKSEGWADGERAIKCGRAIDCKSVRTSIRPTTNRDL